MNQNKGITVRGKRVGLGHMAKKNPLTDLVIHFLAFHRFQSVRFETKFWGLGNRAFVNMIMAELGCTDIIAFEKFLIDVVGEFTSYVAFYYYKSYIRAQPGKSVIKLDSIAKRCPRFLSLFDAIDRARACLPEAELLKVPFIGFALTPNLIFGTSHNKQIAIPGVHATKFSFDFAGKSVNASNEKNRINDIAGGYGAFGGDDLVDENDQPLSTPELVFVTDLNLLSFGDDGSMRFDGVSNFYTSLTGVEADEPAETPDCSSTVSVGDETDEILNKEDVDEAC